MHAGSGRSPPPDDGREFNRNCIRELSYVMSDEFCTTIPSTEIAYEVSLSSSSQNSVSRPLTPLRTFPLMSNTDSVAHRHGLELDRLLWRNGHIYGVRHVSRRPRDACATSRYDPLTNTSALPSAIKGFYDGAGN